MERLEQFFEANAITGESKRRATFLSVVGPASYKLLRSLLAPTKPSEKIFEQLVAVLTDHYSPPPPEVMQRFHCNSWTRQPGESVAAFMADLDRLAEHCKFGTTLNEMLCDRLVHGINDERIREKLLQEKDLTYDRAIAIAQRVETASKNLKEMKVPKSDSTVTKSESVHKVFRKKSPPERKEVTCHRCGTPGHLATMCHFELATNAERPFSEGVQEQVQSISAVRYAPQETPLSARTSCWRRGGRGLG